MTRGQNWRGIIVRAGLIALAVMLIALLAWRSASHWRPSPTTYPIQGVDVSEAQGAIDWLTVHAQGADFAYVRATYGASGRDSRFGENWAGTAGAGLRRGALHVYSLCASGAEQANIFNTTVPKSDDALPAAVEIDFAADCPRHPPRAALISELARFLAAVETHTGKPMLLLTSHAIEREYRLSAAIARSSWSARDFLAPDYAARPWRMWRANDMRRIEGIDGPVNWDVVAP